MDDSLDSYPVFVEMAVARGFELSQSHPYLN